MLLLAALALGPLGSLPPNRQRNYSAYAAQLHNDLLATYVRSQPPISDRDPAMFDVYKSQAGTDVSVQVRFFKLEAVEAAFGRMRIKVWWRMKWQDQRLKWDPADYGGISEVRFFASSFSDPETSEIWLPDITPYNAADGLMATLDPAMAVVNPSGTVFWSRPGTIELLCRFSGLASFPFGGLACMMEAGGWTASGTIQGVNAFEDGCAVIDKQEEVALSSYTEYHLDKVECNATYYSYANFDADVWPVLQFRVYVERVAFYYWNMTILPCIIYTALAFAVFFMSFEVGERLSFGVTLVLTSEVSKTIVAQQVPQCGELLWMELYFDVNLLFTMIALLETCVVLGLAYNTEAYLVPPFFNPWKWAWLHELCCSKRRVASEPSDSKPGSAAAARMRGLVTEGTDAKPPVEPPLQEQAEGSAFMDAAGRLLFFENLFYRLDPDGDGSITADDLRVVLAFTALDMSAAQFEAALVKADSNKRDGKLDREEFVDLCIDVLWNVPIPQLEAAATNYAANAEALEKRINTQWRRTANNIDRHSRFWVPFLYFLCLLWLFSLDLDDRYILKPEDAGEIQPIAGAWDAYSTEYHMWLVPSLVSLLVPVTCVATVTLLSYLWRRRKERQVAAMLAATASSSEHRARVQIDAADEEQQPVASSRGKS